MSDEVMGRTSTDFFYTLTTTEEKTYKQQPAWVTEMSVVEQSVQASVNSSNTG